MKDIFTQNFAKVFFVTLTATLVFGGFFIGTGSVKAISSSITTYSDSACTTEATTFNVGDIVYVHGTGYSPAGGTAILQWSTTPNDDFGASGPVAEDGTFCISTHTISASESGSYTITVIQNQDDPNPAITASANYEVPVIVLLPPATLTVNKVLVPSTDAGTFNLQIDGETAGTGTNVGNGGTTEAVTLTEGTHTVSETAGTEDTTLSNYLSVISGDCAADGSVTLSDGDAKTCTITNSRLGSAFIDTNKNHVLDSGEVTYPTIQAAVDASVDGDFIQATAGLFPELVTINDKSVTVNGAQVGVDARTRTVSDGSESVVGISTGGFKIESDNVTIDGFTVTGVTSNLNAGIHIDNTTGNHTIVNNILTQNVMGLYLNSNTDSTTTVSQNLFNNNNMPGSASGNGIYSDQGLSNATISDNTFTGGHLNSSIILVSDVSKNITITGNTLSSDNEILITNTDGATISDNIITNSLFHGIQLGGGNHGITVTGNVITGNMTFATASGIRINGESSNSDISISNNSITGNKYGINITAEVADDVTVNFNDLSQNFVSLYYGDTHLIKTLNAENNWWGCATTPVQEAESGEEGELPQSIETCGMISHDNNIVDFSPWLATLNLSGNNPVAGQIKNSDDALVGFDTGLQDKFTATGANPQATQTAAIEADNRALYNVNVVGPNAGDTTVGDMVLFAGQDSTLINSLVINTPAPVTPPSSGGGGGYGYLDNGPNSASAIQGFGGNQIMEDINEDGKVDILDLNILLVNWGTNPTNPRADVNRDGKVDILDYNLLMVNWTI